MTNTGHFRASRLSILLVVIGLGQGLGGCSSEEPQPNAAPSANIGGRAVANGGTSASSSSSANAGSDVGATPGAGGSGIGGENSAGGAAGWATANGGNSAGSSANGGLTSGGYTSGGSAIGGLASAGAASTTGGASAGGASTGGASTGGASAGSASAGSASAGSASAGGATVGGASAGGATVGGASAGGTAGSGPLPGLPTASSVLEAMQRANSYFVGRWPDPTKDIVTDKTRPSNLWTRAVYYEGLMGLYSIEPNAIKKASYYDYAVTWASTPAHPYTMTYTAAGTMTSNADNQACGQTYIDLYRIDPKAERIAVIKANIDDMINKRTVNVWTWIDAIQMSMPVFAKLGKTLNDTKYFDAMWSLYAYSRNTQGGGLFNPAEGLWWRDFHFNPGGGTKQVMSSAIHNAIPVSTTDAYIVAPNGKNLYWSRGNGWIMAALVRVLDELPNTDAHRAQYIADLQAMAAALLPIQRSDGFWTESLADPTHCAAIGLANQDGPETSGTALFAYGLAWGIRHGHLDATSYGPALVRAWNGLVTTALQPDGLLGYVQSTGDRPCTGPAPLAATTLANFDDYGVGSFLLAGAEVYRLTSN